MHTQQIKAVICRLEHILHLFFEAKQISCVLIEKYRWNEPQVAAIWCGQDGGIHRNINLSVENNGCLVRLEANAWVDDYAALQRRWVHKPFGAMRVELIEVKLEVITPLLTDIFAVIMQITVDDLINVAPLSPLNI